MILITQAGLLLTGIVLAIIAIVRRKRSTHTGVTREAVIGLSLGVGTLLLIVIGLIFVFGVIGPTVPASPARSWGWSNGRATITADNYSGDSALHDELSRKFGVRPNIIEFAGTTTSGEAKLDWGKVTVTLRDGTVIQSLSLSTFGPENQRGPGLPVPVPNGWTWIHKLPGQTGRAFMPENTRWEDAVSVQVDLDGKTISLTPKN